MGYTMIALGFAVGACAAELVNAGSWIHAVILVVFYLAACVVTDRAAAR